MVSSKYALCWLRHMCASVIWPVADIDPVSGIAQSVADCQDPISSVTFAFMPHLSGILLPDSLH